MFTSRPVVRNVDYIWLETGYPLVRAPISGFLRQDRKSRDRNSIQKPERCSNQEK